MNETEVIWRPLPGSQTLALSCPCNIVLLCGSRAGGKTDSQLMMFRKHVGRGYGPFWRGIICDVSYKGLDDVVSKSKRWFLQFNDGAKFLSATSQYKWVWPTGEELLFRSGSTEKDYMSAQHGQEFSFVGHNELTKYPDSIFFDCMMSCNRSSFTQEKDAPIINRKTGERAKLPNIPLQVVATTNPHGPGRAWVKKRFIDPAPYGKIIKKSVEIISPKTKALTTVEKTQVTIFSSYVENIYLAPEYIAELHQEPNINKKKAWLSGDWNCFSGGAFSDLWDSRIHGIPQFTIPKNWYVDRSFDWGSAAPFSCDWFAECNGEEVTLPNGKKFCPVAGSLILFYEWYGARKEDWGRNKGLKMASDDVARGIKSRERKILKDKLYEGTVYGGPADNSIRNVIDQASDSIEKIMEDEGVSWASSDKSPGSRIVGAELFRTRLKNSRTGEGPGFYVMRGCEAALYFIPEFQTCPKNPEDVDTSLEEHKWDSVRYRILSSNNRLAGPVRLNTPK